MKQVVKPIALVAAILVIISLLAVPALADEGSEVEPQWPWSRTVTVTAKGVYDGVRVPLGLRCERATLRVGGQSFSGSISNGILSCTVRFTGVPVNTSGTVSIEGRHTFSSVRGSKGVSIGKPWWGSTWDVGEVLMR